MGKEKGVQGKWVGRYIESQIRRKRCTMRWVRIEVTSGFAGMYHHEKKDEEPRKGCRNTVNPTIPSLQRAGWMPGKSRQMAHQATFSLAVLFRLIKPRQVCVGTQGFQNSTVKVLVW